MLRTPHPHNPTPCMGRPAHPADGALCSHSKRKQGFQLPVRQRSSLRETPRWNAAPGAHIVSLPLLELVQALHQPLGRDQAAALAACVQCGLCNAEQTMRHMH